MGNRGVLLGALVVAVLGVGGCAGPDSDEQSGVRGDHLIGSFDPAAVTGNLDVRDASLVGAIADVSGIRHYATGVTAWTDGTWGSFHIVVDKGDTAAMAIVDLWDLSSVGLWTSSDGGPAPGVSVVGCAGPEPGVWEFDAGAEDVTVDVEQDAVDPDVLTVTFTGRIPDYRDFYFPGEDGFAIASQADLASLPSTIISGSVTFVRPPEGYRDNANPLFDDMDGPTF